MQDLKEGDADSKYFHMKANGHRHKHLIPYLKQGDRIATAMEKLNLASEYFINLMGSPELGMGRSILRLEELNLRQLMPELAQDLESEFTMEEVKRVIMDMPSDRAPEPDGFSGLFYKLSWDIIALTDGHYEGST